MRNQNGTLNHQETEQAKHSMKKIQKKKCAFKVTLIHEVFASMCIPMVSGIVFLMVMQYQYTFEAIDDWRNISENQIMVSEKKKLHNYLSSNPNTVYSKCQMRDFQTQNVECPQYVHDQFDRNRNLIDLWFHRTSRLEKDLDPTDKELLNINLIFITLAKGIYSVRKKGLLDQQWIYNSFNTSLIVGAPASTLSLDSYYQTCIPGQFSEPYDPRCRPWYQMAYNSEGLQFEKPYVYAYYNSIGMTASSKITDGNNKMQSILSIDFGMTNLVDKLFSLQDENDESSIYEGYSVFFHQDNRTVFNHKYWDRKSGELFNWKDLEFNSTTSFPQYQAHNFEIQLNSAIDEGEQNYDFQQFQQIEHTNLFMNFFKGDKRQQFFFSFIQFLIFRNQSVIYLILQILPILITKKLIFIFIFYDNQSLALVYPVEVYLDNKSQEKMKKVMFIARVQRNIVSMILQDVMKNTPILAGLVIGEIIFVSTIVIISLLHFTAVLLHQIAIPLEQLTFFLKHSNLLIQNQKSNELNTGVQTQQNNQAVNQSVIFSTQQRFQQHTQLSYTQQKRDSILSNNGIYGGELSKNKLMITSTQNLNQKDRISARLIQPTSNFQQFFFSSRDGTYLDTKIDNQLITLPAKVNDLTDRNYSPRKRENYISQKTRRKTETLNTKNRESFKELSKKIMDQYQMQQAGDITQVKSSFKEISIIKKTFKILAKIIQFERDGLFDSDKTESLLKFSKAHQIFSKIQNQQAMALCHYNIAKLHAEDRRYDEAIESYQLSLQISFQELGFYDINSFLQALSQGQLFNDEFFINHLRDISQKYGSLLKQIVQDTLISQYPLLNTDQNSKNNNNNKEMNSQNQTNQKIYSQDFFRINKLDDKHSNENLVAAMQSLKLFQLSLELEKKKIPVRKFEILINEANQAELLIYLGNLKEAYQKIEMITNQIFYDSNQNGGIDDDFEQKSIKVKKQITKISSSNIHFLEMRVLFLQGLLQMKQEQFYSSALQFTNMLENALICEPQKKLIALSMLHQIFKQSELSTNQIVKLLIKEKHIYSHQLLQSILQYKFNSIPSSLCLNKLGDYKINQPSYDVIVLLQTHSFDSGMQKELANYQAQFLDWFYRFFLQQNKDKISVLNYYSEEDETYRNQVDVLQPLTTVGSEKLLRIIIGQYLGVNKEYQMSQLGGKLKKQEEEEDSFSNINDDNLNHQVWEAPLLRCLDYLSNQNQLQHNQKQLFKINQKNEKQEQSQDRRIPLIIFFSQQQKLKNLNSFSSDSFQKIFASYSEKLLGRFPKILQINPTDVINFQNVELIDDKQKDVLMGMYQENETLSDSANLLRNQYIANQELFSSEYNPNKEKQQQKFLTFQSSSQCKLYLLRKRMHQDIHFLKE